MSTGRGVYDIAGRSAYLVRIRRRDERGERVEVSKTFPYDPSAPVKSVRGKTAVREKAEAFAAEQRQSLRVDGKKSKPTETLGDWVERYGRAQFGVSILGEQVTKEEQKTALHKKKGEQQEINALRMLYDRLPDIMRRLPRAITAEDFGEAPNGALARLAAAPSSLQRGTRLRYLAVLRAAWVHCAEGMPWPLSGQKIAGPNNSRVRVVEPDEFDLIIGAMRDTRAGTRAAVLFLRWTAARSGEAVKLKWADLHKADGHLIAELRDTKTPRQGQVKNRTVPVPKPAAEAIRALAQAEPDAKVFGAASNHTLSRAWERGVKRTRGLRDNDHMPADAPRIHDLRHTRLTELANAGLPILQLSAVSGHSELRMLARYYNPKPVEIADLVAAADAALKKRGRRKAG